MKMIMIIVFGMSLLACGAAFENLRQEAAMQKDQELCRIDDFEALIGKDASLLETMDLPDPHRIIRPGSPVTKDLRPNRVNFLIDDQNRILGVKCF